MALDGIFLSTITSEIRNEIIDCKIDKINQPEKDELLISIRGKKKYKTFNLCQCNLSQDSFNGYIQG